MGKTWKVSVADKKENPNIYINKKLGASKYLVAIACTPWIGGNTPSKQI
jgi:hypothetical protein